MRVIIPACGINMLASPVFIAGVAIEQVIVVRGLGRVPDLGGLRASAS
jgi:hypothetical protein